MSYAAPVSGNRMMYGGYLMRSNLEVQLAVALDVHRIAWQYEAHAMTLPDQRRYIPDFYLPQGVGSLADANWIEVKDRKVIWRCAETLGLSPRGNQGHEWLPPTRLADVDLDSEWWRVIRKPVLASIAGARVLMVGASSINAAVLLMHKGLVTARRHHPLTATIDGAIDVEGTVAVSDNEVLRAAQWVAGRHERPWLPDTGSTFVHNAVMGFHIHRFQSLMCVAQEQQLASSAELHGAA